MRAVLVALMRLWRLLWHPRSSVVPRAKDDLPPDRVVGNTVYRAFKIPATATVEEFTDALDLTLEEAASWDPKTEPTPPAIRVRQQERYRNHLRARKGTPSRVQATEDGEAPRLTARLRIVSPITTASKRVQLPGTQPHRRSRPPLKTVGHYPLGGVRQLPNFIIGDVPGVERRCSCGFSHCGSAEEVEERWQAHLHADEATFGSKAADRVFAWLEKHQERAEGRAASVDKARSLLKATSLLSVLFLLALSVDAARSGRWNHDFKDPLIRSIAEAARSVGATSSTITASAAGGSSNTNGAWVGTVQPTSSDDVVIDGTSAGITIPSATTLSCRSLNATGGKLTFAATTSTLSAGDASGGAVTFSSTSTVTLTAIGTINFLATTASTTYSLTTGGKVMPNLTVNTASTTTIQLADAVTATGATVKLTAGIVDFNSKSVTAGTWTYTAGTVTTGTQTLTVSGATTTFAGGGQTYSSVSLTGSGTATLSGANTFANLTRTGTATKTDVLTVSANQIVTSALTLGGNSTQGVNRLLVQSSVANSQRAITVGSVVINGDVDLQDMAITYSGGASWTNSGNAWVGDALGNNTTITTNRTAPATQTATGTASFTWSTHGWTSRVPLPQDNVVINNAFAAGQTITADMLRLGADIDFTGCTGNPILLRNTGTNTVYGSITLVSGITTTGTNQNLTLGGRGSHTLTTAGVSLVSSANTVTRSGAGGTYTLGDAYVSVGALVVTFGTLAANNFAVTALTFSMGNANGRINMGSGTWSVSQTTATTVWNVTAGAVQTDTATVAISSASASNRIFAGGGKTYGTLTYTAAGSTGSLSITGANTFSTINFSDATNARILILPASTTTTVTTFNVQGLVGKRMTVNSSSGGTAATLALSAMADCAYCDFQDITATTSPLVARRGRNVSGNTGITFPTIPVFDAAAAGTFSVSTASLTFAATVNAGANRMLRVGVSLLNAASQTVTGITYGGVAMTVAGTVANGTGARGEMWYLVNPAVGTANVVVTLSAAAAVSAGGDSWSNVDQGAPIGLWTTATGTGTGPTVTVVSSTLEQVVDVATTAATDLTAGAGQTADWDNGVAGVTGAGSREAGVASRVMSWTSTLSGLWALGAAPIFGALVVSTNLAGSSTPTGAVVDTVKKFLSGSETPVGTVKDTASKPLAGSTTPTGALTDTAVKVASGSTTPSGSLIDTVTKILSGAETPSGLLTDTVSRSFNGSETPTGAVVKTLSKPLAGSETPSGVVTDTSVKALGGTETPSGLVVRTTGKHLSGSETSSGAVTKSASIHLSGSQTPTGTVLRTFIRDFFGSLTPTGGVRTFPVKALGGVFAPAGRLLIEVVRFIRDRRSCEVPTPTLRYGVAPGIPGLRSPRLENASVDPWSAEWSGDIDGGTPSSTGPGTLDGGDL